MKPKTSTDGTDLMISPHTPPTFFSPKVDFTLIWLKPKQPESQFFRDSAISIHVFPEKPTSSSGYWIRVIVGKQVVFENIKLSVVNLFGNRLTETFPFSKTDFSYGMEVWGNFPGNIDRIYVEMLDRPTVRNPLLSGFINMQLRKM